jgi:hypothetical protein
MKFENHFFLPSDTPNKLLSQLIENFFGSLREFSSIPLFKTDMTGWLNHFKNVVAPMRAMLKESKKLKEIVLLLVGVERHLLSVLQGPFPSVTIAKIHLFPIPGCSGFSYIPRNRFSKRSLM